MERRRKNPHTDFVGLGVLWGAQAAAAKGGDDADKPRVRIAKRPARRPAEPSDSGGGNGGGGGAGTALALANPLPPPDTHIQFFVSYRAYAAYARCGHWAVATNGSHSPSFSLQKYKYNSQGASLRVPYTQAAAAAAP